MTTFRIYGQRLGESDTWIDVTKEEVVLGTGTVHLAAVNDSRTWEMPQDVIEGCLSEYTAGRHGDIADVNHNIWSRLSGVRSDLATEPFASDDTDVSENLTRVFQYVMAVMVGGDASEVVA
jgi:hypothetical protein